MAKALVVKSAMRSEGNDPAHTHEAESKRSASQRSQMHLNQAWEATNPTPMTEADYRALVLPQLRKVRLSEIRRAVGISKGYAAQLKKGDLVPHPRLREALNTLVTGGSDGGPSDIRSGRLMGICELPSIGRAE
ncbi:MAG: hypothetical protein ACJ789_16700 [Thermomicrobiales bacterium]